MTDDLDTIFASLLASRLCHDVANPVGALSTALDVLDTESDSEMRAHAQSLLKESADRLRSWVEFARLAYGASGSMDGELDTETIRGFAVAMYVHMKPELRWTLPTKALPKREARVLMNLLLTAERLTPRAGSEVLVEDYPSGFLLLATGRKAKMPDDVAAALSGDVDVNSCEAKVMPAVLAQKLAVSAGKTVVFDETEETVSIYLQ